MKLKIILQKLIPATVDPNEIVPRQGPPSVDYKISDKKVNQIYIAFLGHSCSVFFKVYNFGPRLTINL